MVGAGTLWVLCLISPSALANGVLVPELAGAIYSEGPRLAGLDVASMALALVASLLFVISGRRLRALREGIALGYVACGIALLGMTRVFYVVVGTGVITIHADTLEIWSHAIYCLAMVVSICGGKVLSRRRDREDPLASPRALVRWCLFAGLATAAIFLTADPLDGAFVAAFHNSFFDRFPAEHLVAFIISAIALVYMVLSVDIDETLSGASKNAVLIFPLMLGYFLFSLEHLWELLMEILHIRASHSMTMAERVEQMIILSGFVVVTLSGWRLWSVTGKSTRPSVRL